MSAFLSAAADDPDGAEIVAIARKMGVLPADAPRSSGIAKVDEIFELRGVTRSDKPAAQAGDVSRDPDGHDVIALARKLGLSGVRPAGAP
jgi:hypothetical protein